MDEALVEKVGSSTTIDAVVAAAQAIQAEMSDRGLLDGIDDDLHSDVVNALAVAAVFAIPPRAQIEMAQKAQPNAYAIGFDAGAEAMREAAKEKAQRIGFLAVEDLDALPLPPSKGA